MARPTPAGEEIPPSRVDVPPQKRELEIQTPSTQAPARSSEPPESNEQLPAPATQPAPGLQGLPLRPTEEPSEPSFREVPGGGGGGPSFQQSPFTPPQGGSSSSLKNRVRGVASEGFAAAGDMRGSQAAWPQTAERKDAATLTIANSGAGRGYMTRISTPDQEPELFLPSLAARPLAGETRGQTVWSGNPLRGDATAPTAADRGAMPAVALDVNRGDSERTELGSITPSGSRANPLR